MATMVTLPVQIGYRGVTPLEALGIGFGPATGPVTPPQGYGSGVVAVIPILAPGSPVALSSGQPVAGHNVQAAVIPKGATASAFAHFVPSGALKIQYDASGTWTDTGASVSGTGPSLGDAVALPAGASGLTLFRAVATGGGDVGNVSLVLGGQAVAADPCVDPLAAYVGWGDLFCYDDTADFNATADFTEQYYDLFGPRYAVSTTELLDGHPTMQALNSAGADRPFGWEAGDAADTPLADDVVFAAVFKYPSATDIVLGSSPVVDGGGRQVLGVVYDDGIEVYVTLTPGTEDVTLVSHQAGPAVIVPLGDRSLLCNDAWTVVAVHKAGSAVTAYVYPYGAAPAAVGSVTTASASLVLQGKAGDTQYAYTSSTDAHSVGKWRLVYGIADAETVLAAFAPVTP